MKITVFNRLLEKVWKIIYLPPFPLVLLTISPFKQQWNKQSRKAPLATYKFNLKIIDCMMKFEFSDRLMFRKLILVYFFYLTLASILWKHTLWSRSVYSHRRYPILCIRLCVNTEFESFEEEKIWKSFRSKKLGRYIFNSKILKFVILYWDYWETRFLILQWSQ